MTTTTTRTTTTNAEDDALFCSSFSFQTALRLEKAFATASRLSYETVKQSSEKRGSTSSVDAFAREKALRERGRRREESERAKRRLREEHARIEREIERRLERKEEEEKSERALQRSSARRREKDGDATMEKENENQNEREEKDIVRLESEAARLQQKRTLLEVEFENELKRDAERAEREVKRNEKERSRKLETLRKEVEIMKETLENEQLSHERFVQSMLGDAAFWTSEVERRNEKSEEDAESERRALLETLERIDAKATRLKEAEEALRKEMERRESRMTMNARIKERVSAQIVIARCFRAYRERKRESEKILASKRSKKKKSQKKKKK